MKENEEAPSNFEGIQARLDEILKAVSNEQLPLDDAIDLFEEAASLGLRASDLLEDGIDPDQALASENEGNETEQSTQAGA